MKKEKLVLFAGPASKELGSKIARYLNEPLGFMQVGAFSDGETSVEVSQNIRGMDVFLIQSTYQPGNEHLMQLLIMADACKRASANSVSAVIPYFGYSRQDRRVRSARVPITAKVIADMIEGIGIDRLLTIDLHADQIQGFFDIPVDNIYATPLLVADIYKQKLPDMLVVSPDIGGVVRARALAKQLNCDLAIIDKRRTQANVSEVMQIIGDVEGMSCIMVDDIIDTAGTLCGAAKALKDKGAKKVYAYITHPVLSGKAYENIQKSMLDEIVVTDTIPLHEKAKNIKNIRQISVSGMLAETIRRIHQGESVSTLFME